jgi:hypothetical protein
MSTGMPLGSAVRPVEPLRPSGGVSVHVSLSQPHVEALKAVYTMLCTRCEQHLEQCGCEKWAQSLLQVHVVGYR